jgi:hypothetical protein
MRKKERKLIVTFHTTVDAMAMEKCCKGEGIPDRLIPVPRAISAGCGLAWCAPLDCREQICDVMKRRTGGNITRTEKCNNTEKDRGPAQSMEQDCAGHFLRRQDTFYLFIKAEWC